MARLGRNVNRLCARVRGVLLGLERARLEVQRVDRLVRCKRRQPLGDDYRRAALLHGRDDVARAFVGERQRAAALKRADTVI